MSNTPEMKEFEEMYEQGMGVKALKDFIQSRFIPKSVLRKFIEEIKNIEREGLFIPSEMSKSDVADEAVKRIKKDIISNLSKLLDQS